MEALYICNKSMFRMSYAEKWFHSIYLSSRAVHSKIHKSHEFAIEDGDTVVVLCQLLKLGKDIWYLIWQPVLKFQGYSTSKGHSNYVIPFFLSHGKLLISVEIPEMLFPCSFSQDAVLFPFPSSLSQKSKKKIYVFCQCKNGWEYYYNLFEDW